VERPKLFAERLEKIDTQQAQAIDYFGRRAIVDVSVRRGHELDQIEMG
jgi:hypothetical protein